MNYVVLIGNITADPKLTVIPVDGGEAIKVTNFSIATNRTFTRKDGSREQDVTFTNCEAWDSGAERIAASFKKGDRIFIQGSLKNENWEKDGKKYHKDKVRVNHFEKVSLSTKIDNINE